MKSDGYFGYNLERRPVHLGGGWRVRFLVNGVEVGGGVFPAPPWRPGAQKSAYQAAVECGEDWFISTQAARERELRRPHRPEMGDHEI
jgi:hypothetical protein